MKSLSTHITESFVNESETNPYQIQKILSKGLNIDLESITMSKPSEISKLYKSKANGKNSLVYKITVNKNQDLEKDIEDIIKNNNLNSTNNIQIFPYPDNRKIYAIEIISSF